MEIVDSAVNVDLRREAERNSRLLLEKIESDAMILCVVLGFGGFKLYGR